MIGFPGGWELAIVLVVAFLIFGTRLPKMARALGSSIIEFKRGTREGISDKKDDE